MNKENYIGREKGYIGRRIGVAFFGFGMFTALAGSLPGCVDSIYRSEEEISARKETLEDGRRIATIGGLTVAGLGALVYSASSMNREEEEETR